MQKDDVSRAKLQSTIANIRAWAEPLSHHAVIQESDDIDSWHIAVKPHTPGACPFELMITGDELYDIRVAGEGYEDHTVESWELFLPLLKAISEGNVIQRKWTSPVTGNDILLETRITPDTTSEWFVRRSLSALRKDIGEDELTLAQVSEKHFLPYQRN